MIAATAVVTTLPLVTNDTGFAEVRGITRDSSSRCGRANRRCSFDVGPLVGGEVEHACWIRRCFRFLRGPGLGRCVLLFLRWAGGLRVPVASARDFDQLHAHPVRRRHGHEGAAYAGHGLDRLADAHAAPGQLDDGGFEVIDFERDVVDALALALEEARERRVGPLRRGQLQQTIAEREVGRVYAEGGDGGVAGILGGEERGEGGARLFEVADGDGDVVDAEYAHGGSNGMVSCAHRTTKASCHRMDDETTNRRAAGGDIAATAPAAATAVAAIRDAAARVRENVGRVIVGREDVVEMTLVAMLCNGHVLIEDVPGIGKTMMAKALARSIGCSFKRIQFTPDLMPSDITGINFYNQATSAFEFRPGPLIANIVLADEINRATPRTQSALLEAMEEHQLTVDGVTTPLPAPFVVLATQNPVELEGTFPLPEAQLDRFLLRVRMGYPDAREEDEIVQRFEAADPLGALQPVIEAADLVRLSSALTAVRCEPSVRDYLVRIVRATRDHAAAELGASPRASLALFRASRALAAIRGRDYILPDDAKHLAVPVLAHRITLSAQSRLRGRDDDSLVREIVEEIPVPVEG